MRRPVGGVIFHDTVVDQRVAARHDRRRARARARIRFLRGWCPRPCGGAACFLSAMNTRPMRAGEQRQAGERAAGRQARRQAGRQAGRQARARALRRTARSRDGHLCKPASAAWLECYLPRCRSPAIRAGRLLLGTARPGQGQPARTYAITWSGQSSFSIFWASNFLKDNSHEQVPKTHDDSAGHTGRTVDGRLDSRRRSAAGQRYIEVQPAADGRHADRQVPTRDGAAILGPRRAEHGLQHRRCRGSDTYRGTFMADDFADRFNLGHSFNSPIVHVKWWGSYLNDFVSPNFPVDKFLISIESDVRRVLTIH